MKRYARITNTLTGEFEDKELNEKQLALFPLEGKRCIELYCANCPLNYLTNDTGYSCMVSSGVVAKSTWSNTTIELLPISEPTEQDIMNCKTIGDLPNGVYCYENEYTGVSIFIKKETYTLYSRHAGYCVWIESNNFDNEIDWHNEYYEFLGSL